MKTEQKIPEYVRPEIEVIALRESAGIMNTSGGELNSEDELIFEQQ